MSATTIWHGMTEQQKAEFQQSNPELFSYIAQAAMDEATLTAEAADMIMHNAVPEKIDRRGVMFRLAWDGAFRVGRC